MGVIGAVRGSTAVAEYVAVLLLYGGLGYFYAVRSRRSRGSTPWRLPPFLWALIGALLPFWGLLLEMVASMTTRGSAHPGSPFGIGSARLPYQPRAPWQGEPGQAPYGTAPGHPLAGSPANPAGGSATWPTEGSLRPGPGGWRPSPDAEPAPLFGWYPDPDGEHESRYWDGRSWTETVSDAGDVSTAPLGPPRAPWETGPNS